MFKRIASIITLTAFLPIFQLPAAAEVSRECTVYVSPSGNDGANGTINSPVATIEGARDRIRKYKRVNGKNGKYTVIFREGVYHFNKSAEFTEADSGYKNNPIVYKAYDGENVKFSGAVSVDVSDFRKVTDREILQRLPDSSREKVGYLDLKEQGITKDMIPSVPNTVCRAGDMRSSSSFNDVSVILDGEEQPISQWPNGRYNYATFKTVSAGANKDGKGGTFEFSDVNPIKWMNAKDIYLEGFFGYDYTQYRTRLQSIDPVKKEITLRYGSVTSTQSKRWKALNLLEEIDIPGEWYIDRDNMILYYYPRYNLSQSKMEITVFADRMIKLAATGGLANAPDNITFDGITFENTRNGGIYGGLGADNITIKNCTFHNVDGYSIFVDGRGGQNIRFGEHDEWETLNTSTIDGGNNWVIENNIFYQLSSSVLEILGGGDWRDLTPSNHKLRNNYVTLAQLESPGGTYGIAMTGCRGTYVENNLIHNLPFHAINDNGRGNYIRYNEINNAIKSTSDSGAIYSGRTLIGRGTEIAYNFIKDVNHQIDGQGQHNRAIYCDDEISQQIIHHNILVDGDKAITFGGSSGQVYDNTAVDMITGYHVHAYGGQWTAAQIAKYDKWVNAVSRGMNAKDYEFYNKKFPEIMKEYEFYKNSPDGVCEALYNVITDNVGFNIGDEMPDDQYFIDRGGIAYGNDKYTEYDAFVDPDNYDYRIKKDSQVYKDHPGLVSEDFDLSQIGIQWDEFGSKERVTGLRDFKMIYPQNGASGIDRQSVNFVWQQSVNADKYLFELSDTPDFSNIIAKDYTYDNVYVVDELNKETTYYWRVTAINETRALRGEWKPETAEFSFTTSEIDNVSFDSLILAKNSVVTRKQTIIEGTEPGEYKTGTLANIDEKIAVADKMINSPKGTYTREEVDRAEKELSDSISTYVWQNSGFANIGKYLDNKDNWYEARTDTPIMSLENNTLTVGQYGGETEDSVSLMPIKNMSKGVFFTFKAKFDFIGNTPSNWVGIGIRGNEREIIYGQYNYFIIAKQDILEFQIRSAGLSGIIETAENKYIKNGQWHDIVFGTYDCGFGQLSLLMVDGEVVFNFIDDTLNQLRTEGCLTFYTTKGSSMTIKPYEGNVNQDFDKLVDNAIYRAAEKMGKWLVDDTASEKTAVLADGTAVYYYGGKLRRYSTPTGTLINDNKVYIPCEVLANMGITPSDADIVTIGDAQAVAQDVIQKKYSLYTFRIDNSIILTDNNSFYMYNGSVPYNMDMMYQEFKKITDDNIMAEK